MSEEEFSAAKPTMREDAKCIIREHTRRTSDVDGVTRENWNNTEEGIQAVMGEVERIIRQFSLLMPK